MRQRASEHLPGRCRGPKTKRSNPLSSALLVSIRVFHLAANSIWCQDPKTILLIFLVLQVFAMFLLLICIRGLRRTPLLFFFVGGCRFDPYDGRNDAAMERMVQFLFADPAMRFVVDVLQLSCRKSYRSFDSQEDKVPSYPSGWWWHRAHISSKSQASRISTAGCFQSAVIHLHNLSTSNWKNERTRKGQDVAMVQSKVMTKIHSHSIPKDPKGEGSESAEPTTVACFILRLEEQLTSTWNLRKDQHFMRYYNCGTFSRTSDTGGTEILRLDEGGHVHTCPRTLLVG